MPGEHPGRILLVPGFTSPRWVLLPLYLYLKRKHPHIELWDHPRVFSELNVTIEALADKLRAATKAGQNVKLVSHSFGDWVARSALAEAGEVRVAKLISITPVVERVPPARWVCRLTGRMIPELQVMADAERAAAHLEAAAKVEHILIWAKWDLIVRRPKPWPDSAAREFSLPGMHMTLPFQPRLWRLVAEELK